MRIGSTIIDTDSMSTEELTMFIKELYHIRARKEKAEELKNRMIELLNDAKENGFAFIDKKLGHIWLSDEFKLYDGES